MSSFLVDLNLAVVTPERFPGGPESWFSYPERFPGGPESCFSYSLSTFLVDLNLALVTP